MLFEKFNLSFCWSSYDIIRKRERIYITAQKYSLISLISESLDESFRKAARLRPLHVGFHANNHLTPCCYRRKFPIKICRVLNEGYNYQPKLNSNKVFVSRLSAKSRPTISFGNYIFFTITKTSVAVILILCTYQIVILGCFGPRGTWTLLLTYHLLLVFI